MRRPFPALVLLACTFALAFPASLVGAQDATPEAEAASRGSSPLVGDTVSYIGESGSEIATLTVLQMVRPWEEYDEFYEPQAGTEYVAFEIEITHLGRRGDLVVRAFDLRLQDVDGFLLSQAWAEARSDAELSPETDEIVIAPDATATLVVVFQVIEEIELSHLFWLPEYDRMITIADLSES